MTLFNEKIRLAAIQRLHAGDILAGDRKRVVELLEELAEDLRLGAAAHFSDIARDAMSTGPGDSNITSAQAAIACEIPKYFEARLDEVTQMIDREITATLIAHQETADSLITSVRNAAAQIFEIPFHAPESDHAYHLTKHPFWVESRFFVFIHPDP